ncbi:hypothetical protein ACIQAL_22155 [Pseudomonas sp. NPDC088368]|uniref:hypothetical protein n=1 Tax=Pseudomonas sp. NPDC088368 TaxID=3364453 RepID=UPI00380A85D7
MTKTTPAKTLLSRDFYQQCPVVLTGYAWKRLVYRELPENSSEIGQRLATIITAAHRELGFNTEKTTFPFGLYHEGATGDERQWVELLLSVVTLPGQPTYLHLSLLHESQELAKVCA